ncbi:hypothetical protein BDZ89DRAFT_743585 [Hymenopellis radicata]|nr:hypothetical protein BDZ89DRAFT_743585 [Hymenopellis radicata]
MTGLPTRKPCQNRTHSYNVDPIDLGKSASSSALPRCIPQTGYVRARAGGIEHRLQAAASRCVAQFHLHGAADHLCANCALPPTISSKDDSAEHATSSSRACLVSSKADRPFLSSFPTNKSIRRLDLQVSQFLLPSTVNEHLQINAPDAMDNVAKRKAGRRQNNANSDEKKKTKDDPSTTTSMRMTLDSDFDDDDLTLATLL